jgi:hypothetical protein
MFLDSGVVQGITSVMESLNLRNRINGLLVGSFLSENFTPWAMKAK